MSNILAFTGATLAGWIGWALAARFGIYVAFFVSTVASGFGLYYGRKVARDWLNL